MVRFFIPVHGRDRVVIGLKWSSNVVYFLTHSIVLL